MSDNEHVRMPSGTPGTVSATQIYAALVQLGRAPVAHPDGRPDGAIEDDIPELLGALLAVVEQAIFLQAPGKLRDLFYAYHQTASPDVALALLWNRLARTEAELNDTVGSPIVDAAELALRASARMLHLGTRGEMVRKAGAADEDDEKAVRTDMKEARDALRDARMRFEEVRKMLVAAGVRL